MFPAEREDEGVIVYRDASREESTAAKLGRLRRLADAGRTLALLVELGELEQGVVDALDPVADGLSAQRMRLRTAARAAGAAFLADRADRPGGGALRRAAAALDALRRGPLPATIRVHPPEGYVHYALDPAGYAAAAAAYRITVGSRRAARAVVVGVRSIGTSLSAVVAAELGAQRSITVRPRGETGHRHVTADRALTRCVARWTADDIDVLVVDEGPGATGETFEVVVGWLRSIGIEDDRIVLVPSRAWGMPLAHEARRTWFAAARKHTPPHGDDRPMRIARRHGLARPENLSAGRWRSVVPGAADEPSCVAHERIKYLVSRADGGDCLIRYVGLGRWGEEARERAARLADAGVGAPIVGAEDGFLLREWRPGSPATRAAGRAPGFVAALDRYLRARAGRFGTGREVDPAPLIEMLRANAAEALGPGPPGVAAAAARLERLPPTEAVVPDARMQPREWVRTPDGYAKVDAIDHGDGLRLPGPTDAAWDLAGAVIEFRLDDATAARLARRHAGEAGRNPTAMAAAVRAYRAPYAAHALGDASLSAREADTDEDRRRLEAEAAFYRAALRRELEREDSVAA